MIAKIRNLCLAYASEALFGFICAGIKRGVLVKRLSQSFAYRVDLHPDDGGKHYRPRFGFAIEEVLKRFADRFLRHALATLELLLDFLAGRFQQFAGVINRDETPADDFRFA